LSQWDEKRLQVALKEYVAGNVGPQTPVQSMEYSKVNIMPSNVAKTKGKKSKIPATVEPRNSDEDWACSSCNQVLLI